MNNKLFVKVINSFLFKFMFFSKKKKKTHKIYKKGKNNEQKIN